jgi:hypothetical protein
MYAYVCIRQHASAYVRTKLYINAIRIRPHTSAYVSILYIYIYAYIYIYSNIVYSHQPDHLVLVMLHMLQNKARSFCTHTHTHTHKQTHTPPVSRQALRERE